MAELYAQMNAVLSIIPNQQTRCLQVRFRDAANNTYVIDLPQPILGSLLIGMIMQSQHLAPSPDQKAGAAQPMNLNSGRIFTLNDGRSGLELTIENTLKLPLVFPKEAIPILRSALDALERLPTPAGQGPTLN